MRDSDTIAGQPDLLAPQGMFTMLKTFADWTQGREVANWGTNTGSDVLPFQSWRHFKEAFAPELVYRAVQSSSHTVTRCADPFGGSGTTALASQFLGINPIVAEVNPFLADLIEAKLRDYDTDGLVACMASLVRSAEASSTPDHVPPELPPTFVEPGRNGRWLFDLGVARQIFRLRYSIEAIEDASARRLFRVILGGVLVDVSNITINGKGRRYRGNWVNRRVAPGDVTLRFALAARRAISDIHRFVPRPVMSYEVIRGDSRSIAYPPSSFELAVFSPPYPNSFDYTDVYNIELWMLGYLKASEDNTRLRRATLASHVQIDREFDVARGSSVLDDTLAKLEGVRDSLWHRRIPEMVSGYFADLMKTMDLIRVGLIDRGQAWVVIGDSKYGGITVPTARIFCELAQDRAWQIITAEPCRSMRGSAQQGGRPELQETLVVLSAFGKCSANAYLPEGAGTVVQIPMPQVHT